MKFFSRFIKKRKPQKSSDDFKVSIITDKDLSEEVKDAIISVIKDAVMDGEDDNSIVILLFMNVVDNHPNVYINRLENGDIEVII